MICEKKIGCNGFGYDPIFYIPELKKTAAQLSAVEKNKISHRGQGIRNLVQKLQQIRIIPKT
jgi:XTP/dITP diphosphohydrolase